MPEPSPAPQILIVDDDPGVVRLVERILRRAGYPTATAHDGGEALEHLRQGGSGLLLLDLKLPDMDGKHLVEVAERERCHVPFIIITGQGDEREAVEMMKRGALDYLVKDMQFQELLPEVVRRSLKQVERDRKLAEAETLIRRSEQRLRRMVEHLPAGAVYVEGPSMVYNKAATDITGYAQADITTVEEWFRRLFPTRSRQAMGEYRQDRKRGFPSPRVVTITRRDGKHRQVELYGYAFEEGEVWLLHDVTKREQAERILRTEFAATELFTQSTRAETVAPALLRIICEGLDWDLGELWEPQSSGGPLRRRATWQVAGLEAATLHQLSRQAAIRRGRELPGRIWAEARPIWIPNLTRGRKSVLRQAAVEAGLTTALGFPVLLREEVQGVLVFYTRERRDSEPELLSAVSDLGHRVGSFTERRRAVEALGESEKRLQAIFANAPILLFLKDPSGRYLMVNPPFEDLCGRSAQAIRGCTDFELFPAETARAMAARQAQTLNECRAVRFEISFPHPAGGRHYLATHFPLCNEAGEVYALCGLGTDVTELRQLEQEILDISEAEQRRIGQDLHDGLCQHLAGIEFISQALEQQLSQGKRKEAAAAGQIAGLIREAISHTRDLSRGLSPVILEPDGLMASLHLLAENIRKYFGVCCDFQCPEPVLVRDNHVATHLFRIAQEAINNALRHGKARNISLRLARHGRRAVLGIQDDGSGFDVAKPARRGLGLRIMQYRSGVIGGSLVVQRESGGGTSVVCSLDLSRLHPPPSASSLRP